MIVDKIPPEVLRVIFIHYVKQTLKQDERKSPVCGPTTGNGDNVDTDSNIQGQRHRDTLCSPFHLSLVCRHWHSMVVGDPVLWSYIHIHHPIPDDVPIFKMWLQRSSSELLTLSLHEDFDAPLDFSDIPKYAEEFDLSVLSQQKRALFQIIEVAVSVSKRWRAISLSLGEDVGRVFQTEDFHTREFPNLESFEIDMRDTGISSWGDPSSGMLPPIHAVSKRLSSSPKLKAAKWSSYVDSEFQKYAPFSRLVSLSIATVTEFEATVILPCCQELQILEFQHYRPSSTLPALQVDRPIVLPMLQVASLGFFDDWIAVPSFFNLFAAPSLRELDLERGFGRSSPTLRVISSGGLGIGDDKGWKGLIAFLERSECRLQRLGYCPGVELSAGEENVMRENLKNRVFHGLVEYPRRRERGRGVSGWGGMGSL
jgi:hypothetical protein